MIRYLPIVVAAVLLAGGCGKKDDPNTVVSPSPVSHRRPQSFRRRALWWMREKAQRFSRHNPGRPTITRVPPSRAGECRTRNRSHPARPANSHGDAPVSCVHWNSIRKTSWKRLSQPTVWAAHPRSSRSRSPFLRHVLGSGTRRCVRSRCAGAHVALAGKRTRVDGGLPVGERRCFRQDAGHRGYRVDDRDASRLLCHGRIPGRATANQVGRRAHRRSVFSRHRAWPGRMGGRHRADGGFSDVGSNVSRRGRGQGGSDSHCRRRCGSGRGGAGEGAWRRCRTRSSWTSCFVRIVPREADDSSVREEVGRVLVNGLRQGDLPAADRSYLAQLVAARTGLSQPEAEKRVADAVAQAKAAEAKARQAADAARKAAAHMALWTCLALLIGAFVASYAATIGGRQRDYV